MFYSFSIEIEENFNQNFRFRHCVVTFRRSGLRQIDTWWAFIVLTWVVNLSIVFTPFASILFAGKLCKVSNNVFQNLTDVPNVFLRIVQLSYSETTNPCLTWSSCPLTYHVLLVVSVLTVAVRKPDLTVSIRHLCEQLECWYHAAVWICSYQFGQKGALVSKRWEIKTFSIRHPVCNRHFFGMLSTLWRDSASVQTTALGECYWALWIEI